MRAAYVDDASIAAGPVLAHLDPTWVLRFASGMPSVGEDQFPVLAEHGIVDPPDHLTAFNRHTTVKDSGCRRRTFLHGFTDDATLVPFVRNPARMGATFAGFGAILTPDLSVHRDMPLHLRKTQIWTSRQVGAYFQSRGLRVVASVRWGVADDVEYCLVGLPRHSCVAVSTHGVLRDRENRYHFESGLEPMLEGLQPSLLIVHGPRPAGVFDPVERYCRVAAFPADIRRGRDAAARPGKAGRTNSQQPEIPGWAL